MFPNRQMFLKMLGTQGQCRGSAINEGASVREEISTNDDPRACRQGAKNLA